jgi:hypothetical protein
MRPKQEKEKKEEEKKVNLSGTIVSVRGNILQIRPRLRPKMVRASFSNQTDITGVRRVDNSKLQVGLYFVGGAAYSKDKEGKESVSFYWLTVGKERIGQLKEANQGIHEQKDEPGFALCAGKVKSLAPFVFVDDAGKEYTGGIDKIFGTWEAYPGDRNTLLIGVRVDLSGISAPDGVIQASSISPERDYSALGTMFGKILKIQGDMLTIQPRYTKEEMQVSLKMPLTLLFEEKIAPEKIQIGENVTFWGQEFKPKNPPPMPTKIINALALIQGEGRYPSATGENAPVYITGKIASLEPTVTIKTPEGVLYTIHIPAQMPFARLKPLNLGNLRPGAQAMFVLERVGNTDAFATQTVIVNASPWVGYGG